MYISSRWKIIRIDFILFYFPLETRMIVVKINYGTLTAGYHSHRIKLRKVAARDESKVSWFQINISPNCVELVASRPHLCSPIPFARKRSGERTGRANKYFLDFRRASNTRLSIYLIHLSIYLRPRSRDEISRKDGRLEELEKIGNLGFLGVVPSRERVLCCSLALRGVSGQ